MATIETKYSVGDVVFRAGRTQETRQHPCPDCLGSRKWSATSPAGSEYSFDCPRCAVNFSVNDGLSLKYSAYAPSVDRLTIGSVSYNSEVGAHNSGARYMCRETGVGSGQVYEEDRLFQTEDEAMVAAQLLADEGNATTAWVVKAYDKSLAISDYQLDSALIKLAADKKSESHSVLWNLGYLFENIAEAADKDAILEAVEDYKRTDWEADRAKVAA